MVFKDASSRWSYVCLLFIRNLAFSKLTQITKLQAYFSDNLIKKIRLDDEGEFTSKSFLNYFSTTGIEVEHHVAHNHIQNRLAVLALETNILILILTIKLIS